MGGLVLRPVDAASPRSWRWLLLDGLDGSTLADHQVTIDPAVWQFRAFTDLHRYLWANADPQHRLADEAAMVDQIGVWAGATLLGPAIVEAIADRAPVTVTVEVPADLAVLPRWPWELAAAHGAAGDDATRGDGATRGDDAAAGGCAAERAAAGGASDPPMPLARRHVALVYDIRPGPPGSRPSGPAGPGSPRAGFMRAEPVGDTLRMLALFSQPTSTAPLALRRERHALVRLVRELAARRRLRIELRVLQYGVTRATLAKTVREAGGWDLLHVSCHGGIDALALEHVDGSPDEVATADLVDLLTPTRNRVKLAVLSACQSGAATAAETLRWLGLDAPAEELEAHVAAEAGSPVAATGDVAGGVAGDGVTDSGVTDSGVTTGDVATGDGNGSASGLARGLVEALGCAVLGMRYPVGDEFAIKLAERFYEALFDAGQPVDAALRLALPAAAGAVPTPAAPPASLATPVLLGRTAASGLVLRPPPETGDADFGTGSRRTPMAYFPAEPERFVGRTAAMSRASAALAPKSGRSGVLFHGMAGAGKTACALELAYRHEGSFAAHVYWEAPKQPDTHGAAIANLALALEHQLPGFTMVDKVGTVGELRRFAPRLAELCERAGILIVLDNLETLLTDGGAWRDERWPVLLSALTDHQGLSRVVLTSRIVPANCDRDRLLVEPVHALPRDEATLLARELRHLGALLHTDDAEPGSPRTPTTPAGVDETSAEQVEADRALVRRVLGVVQGHPKLLELADAAAGEGREVLAGRVAAAAAVADVRGPAVTAFFAEGESGLDVGGFVAVLNGWVAAAVAGLDEPAALLLQVLCCLEDGDRTQPVVEANWADVWRRLGRPGEPLLAGGLLAVLIEAALVDADTAGPTSTAPGSPVGADTVHSAEADNPGPADAGTGSPAYTDTASPAGADGGTGGGTGGTAPSAVYRVHPGVAEAVRADAPEPVRAAVDAVLAAFWGAVLDQARARPGGEDSHTVARAGLAAAPYLLRRRDWDRAAYLLEQAFFRDMQNPATALAVLPPLRRIADATGTPAHLGTFGRVLARVDPAGAEPVLRRALEAAVAAADFHAASAVGGELVDLLRRLGRLGEALAAADTKAGHTRRAGLGRWTQAGDDGRRLQILYRMGRAGQVLAALDGPGGLLARLDALPDQPDPVDAVRPWNVRELVWATGALAARELGRWERALELNGRVQASLRRRGAGAHETAGTRFNDYEPLIRLGRLGEAEALLAGCQQTFADTGDIPMLGMVFSARAHLAAARGHHGQAAHLEQVALRLKYTRPDPDAIAVSHHNLANWLARTGADPAAALAHRLAATLLYRLVGNADRAAISLREVAADLAAAPAGTTPPTTVADLAATVEEDVDGVRLAALVDALTPDRAAADQALRDLLDDARTLPAEEEPDVRQHLAE